MPLDRHQENPILLPRGDSWWESKNVFNPAVTYQDGLFHMYYRAQGEDWVSRLGYAVSTDGLRFNRMREPVIGPWGDNDVRGIEDPRITKLEDRYYMCYTAYGLGTAGPFIYGGSVTPMIARSDNLYSWHRLGHIVTGEDNKDHVLFPRRVQGKYLAFHRRRPDVWLARSDNLVNWPEEEMHPVFGPRPDNAWDSQSVGANGVPIETDEGWLCLYHGYDEEKTYRFGVVLLDLEEPTLIRRRPREFVLEPREVYEVRGDVPNVVFSNANPLVGGTVYVYYGGADHVTCLATCELRDLLDFTLLSDES
jgi:predicted GH43/DUF377 family glycosyl hydrolase